MAKPKAEHAPQYRDEQARGNAAKVILENPVFKDATAAMREKLIESWIRTAPDDVNGREWFHKMMLAQTAYHQSLTKMIQTGDMARMSLDDIQGAQSPRRNRNG